MRKTDKEIRKRRVLEVMRHEKLTPSQVFERFGVPFKTLDRWRAEQSRHAPPDA